ncbi:Vacuolar protein sorting-associated protein 45 [Bienertia sinuspersici]
MMLDRKRILNNLWSEIRGCVSLVESNDEDLLDLVEKLKGFRLNLKAKHNASNNQSSKTQDIKLLLGASIPSETLIKLPQISKNKGSGTTTSKRLKGDKEKAMEKNEKKKRLCRGCGELSYHDIRNCP